MLANESDKEQNQHIKNITYQTIRIRAPSNLLTTSCILSIKKHKTSFDHNKGVPGVKPLANSQQN
jgi:hypothetical protein